MEHRIVGTVLPVLEVTLQEGEQLVAEAGRLSWMQDMRLQTQAQGGFLRSMRRAVGGGTFFLTEFTPQGESGMVAFAARVPGEIVEVPVGESQYLVHEHGFLCATTGIELSVGFQRSLGAGIFGGTGFVLQRLAGNATAYVDLSGEVVRYDLAPGQVLQVQPGHIGMFDADMDFEIVTIPGVRNLFLGGDGLFLAQLRGPGTVWLQSMPLPHLASVIARYLPSK